MYRNVKDGDKGFQIIAIDNVKHTTDEGYQGACFINREEDRSIPTFGENRIYHVNQYNKEKDSSSPRVSDNLHEKNYYLYVRMLDDIGIFRNMEHLTLVVREDANTYIEGYIDNVALSAIDTSAATTQYPRFTYH